MWWSCLCVLIQILTLENSIECVTYDRNFKINYFIIKRLYEVFLYV